MQEVKVHNMDTNIFYRVETMHDYIRCKYCTLNIVI